MRHEPCRAASAAAVLDLLARDSEPAIEALRLVLAGVSVLEDDLEHAAACARHIEPMPEIPTNPGLMEFPDEMRRRSSDLVRYAG